MNTYKFKKTKNFFQQKSFSFQKEISCFSTEKQNVQLDFLNLSFDKGRLKSIVSWFFENYGQYKTLQLLDKLKTFGFGYATLGGLSLGIDDLKIPDQKISLMATAETKVAKDLKYFRNAKITGIERMQRLIYTWNQTNDTLKQEVIKYFETKDLFNPIYMMAFSGARGNMSQVRQLVGMRGLMSDPQGQIIDFPIQSNFREGLTLTEYLISTYGARKGIVDTALRTATAGYLTRRLVDVAQHVIVARFDCGTMRGIFVFDMKEANKTIYSFQNRLIGRVLAQDIVSFQQTNGIPEKKKIAVRNQEIDQNFAAAIAQVTKKAFVRSPLTCETPRLLCQLCYGWSLSQGKLVSVGEAVGVIAAQSIGEPGTQLTMRTFHTGGVFAGGLTDQILAPFDGQIQYVESIAGTCIRTSLSDTAFLTKMPGSFFVQKKDLFEISFAEKKEFQCPESGKIVNFLTKNKNQFSAMPTLLSSHSQALDVSKKFAKSKKKVLKEKNPPFQNSIFSEFYKIPAYAVLYVRNLESVQKKQLLAQFSTVEKKQLQYGSAEQTLFSNCAGEFYLSNSNIPFSNKEKFQKMNLLLEKRSNNNSDFSQHEAESDIVWRTKTWANIWLLSGKVIYNSFENNQFSQKNMFQKGDFITHASVLNQILWKKPKNFQFQKIETLKTSQKLQNMFYWIAMENSKNSFFSAFSDFFLFQKKSNSFFFSSFVFLNLQQNGVGVHSNFSLFQQKKRFFPLCPVLNKNEEQKIHNQKFFKRKNNILFSQNFRRIFFSSPSKTNRFSFLGKTNKTKKSIVSFFLFFSKSINTFVPSEKKTNSPFEENSNTVNSRKRLFSNTENIYSFQKIGFSKIKQQSKRMFSKFSTFGFSPSFHISKYAKLFHGAKKSYRNKSLQFSSSAQRFRVPFFSIFKTDLGSIWFLRNFPFQQVFPFQVLKKPNLDVCAKKKTSFFSSELFQSLKKNNWEKRRIHPFSFFSKNFKKKGETNGGKSSKNSILFNSFVFKKMNTFSKRKKVCTLESRFGFPEKSKDLTTVSKKLIFTKSLYSFHFDKLRYRDFGYTFSVKGKKWSQQNSSFHFFRLFSQLNLADYDETQTRNRGKNEKDLSIGNGYFFGKDIPNTLSYCFPKDFETLTNGIFLLNSYEQLSKKQKLSQFLCVKRKNIDISACNCSLRILPIFIFQKYNQQPNFFKISDHKKLFELDSNNHTNKNFFLEKTEKKILNNSFAENFVKKMNAFKVSFGSSSFDTKQTSVKFKTGKTFHSFSVSKKVSFLVLNTFSFLQKSSFSFSRTPSMIDGFFHPQKNKAILQKTMFSFKKIDKYHFSENLIFKMGPSFRKVQKKRKADLKCFCAISGMNFTQKIGKNLFFSKNFFHAELYTNEIFWIPQENYIFSNIHLSLFSYLPSPSFSLLNEKHKHQNFFEKQHVQKKRIVSKICFQKIPLFYFSNRQGKKIPFFSKFDGIAHSFSSSTCKNARKLPDRLFHRKRRNLFQNFDWLQQKISFFSEKQQKFSKRVPLQDKLSFAQNNNIFEMCSREKTRKTFSSVFFAKANLKFKKQKTNLFQQERKNQTHRIQKVNSQQKKKSVFKFVPMRFFQKKRFQRKMKVSSEGQNCFFSKQKNFKKSNFCFEKRLFHKKVVGKRLMNFQNNFSFAFFKKRKTSNLQNVQKLFQFNQKRFLLQNNFVFSQKKVPISKYVSHKCFTVLPFQKVSNKNSDHFFNKKTAGFLSQKNETLFEKKNHQIFSMYKKSVPSFETQKVSIKVQSGWVYVFPNRGKTFFWESHQTLFNFGQSVQKNLCFEQNKIYRETFVFDKFHGFCAQSNSFVLWKDQAFENTKAFDKSFSMFSVQTLFQNSHCRFLKEGGLFGINNFVTFHKLNSILFQNENISAVQTKKMFATLFRPFQYRILENSKNSKKFLQSLTIQNTLPRFENSNSLMFSSKKLYQSYHSNISNIQKSHNIFLQNLGDDFRIGSEFRQINFLHPEFSHKSVLKFRNFSHDKKTRDKKLQKYNLVHGSSGNQNEKKEKNQKFLLFQKNSKKNNLKKFHLLSHRQTHKTVKNSNFSMIFSSPKVFEQKKTPRFQHFFFSFYPFQFLPFQISSFSKLSDISKQTPKIPSIFVNSVQNTINFSLCEKKSTFLNQRLFSFDFMEREKSVFLENSSFWLNKEKTNFVFFKKTSKSMWKKSLSQKNSRKFLHSSSKINGFSENTQKVFQNFFFQNNSQFFANSQFFSPFEGELISMLTNETNWWKKASEISTLQKMDTLLSVITKKDLFSVNFSFSSVQHMFSNFPAVLKNSPKNFNSVFNISLDNRKTEFFNKTFVFEMQQFRPKLFIHQKKRKKIQYTGSFHGFQKSEKENFFSKYGFDTKQRLLADVYTFIVQTHKNFQSFSNFDFQEHESSVSNVKEPSLFVTKYDKKLYMLKNFNMGFSQISQKPVLGKFMVYGDSLLNRTLSKPGQIIHVSLFKVTFRSAQPFFVSPKGILHLSITPYIQKNIPIVTLPYQTVQSGDIVQGIPKVEQFFEARTTVQGRLFVSSLPILLKGIFQRYKTVLPLEQAVRQSFLKIQQLIVDGVQRVYRSQGVSIIDKHLEVIVRQMTTKVQIVHGGQTGFFPGELVSVEFVERINKFLMVKIRYEPVILGITRASLEVESFLSASSFQQTTKILSMASICRKKDFLKGLKENLLVGNLIPSGTGYMMLYKNF
uniref:RNA polymerase beta'' subunit n=1 Tax=Coelastrum microporum TaxID=55409 RepID=UPI00226C6EF8|nr:RNA polymerase beta'' subunit [Coelastrum microporum]UWM13052.1 RNA polymerase beta'' subunit [Coelastrum microporum]